MELNIIGHFEIHPINLQTQQIFILRLLTPLAEYQAGSYTSYLYLELNIICLFNFFENSLLEFVVNRIEFNQFIIVAMYAGLFCTSTYM
jgi:hypothetical protein